MEYIAVCLKGLEEIAEKEAKGKKILSGRIKFKDKPKNFKSINRVYKFIKLFEFSKQEDILAEFKKIKNPLGKTKKFKVDCNREGNQDFKSVDVEKLMGVYLQKNSFELSFKEPEKVIIVDILDNKCIFGLLIKDNLQKREYRFKLNPDTLNPCIAYSALSLIKYKKNDILVDPVCRDGIIVIEAGLMKKGKVFGFEKNTRNARINSKIAKVDINLSENEIDWLDTKFKKNSVKITSYLPSVSKRNNEFDIKKLYSEIFHQFKYIIKDYIALIVRKNDLIRSYFTDFKLVKELDVEVGADKFTIFVLKKNI